MLERRPGTPDLERLEGCFRGRFEAMASPCDVIVDTDDESSAHAALEAARSEALRIEHKFSRYRADNIVHAINHAAGHPVEVDEESAGLLDYAAACHEISDGRFDITSGVLRRAWTFDRCEHTPDPAAIAAALALVGWSRVTWQDRTLTLPAGMEIDLGGLGKEYAVDRAATEVAQRTSAAFLVNFGGDLFASGPRRDGRPWLVGVEDPATPGSGQKVRLELARGALATSGDARRYVLVRGRRLGHILDPRTGWPVDGAPRSVTVMAPTCTEAGTLATLAILSGHDAARFLESQGVQHWVVE
jgi:thiamine biosynthesis lipoprotein